MTKKYPAYMESIVTESVFTFERLEDFSFFQEGPGLRNWQFTKAGIKVINVTNMVNGTLDLSKTDRHVLKEEVDQKYRHFLVDHNDIVVASSGNSWGKVALVKSVHLPLLMNTSVIRFKTKNSEKLDWAFLYHFLNSGLFRFQISMLITGSAQPNFGPTHLKKMYLPLPTITEQQKIAAILTSVDEAIEKTEAIIMQTEKVQKGLMQELLTKGIGHTKFKETDIGKIPEKWEVKKLESIARVSGGKRLPKGDALIQEDTGHPYIRVSDMNSKGISLEDIHFVPLKVVEKIKRYRVTKGDLFISVAGTLGLVGKVPDELDGANLTENADRISDINCNSDFLMYVLQSELVQQIIKRQSTTNAQPKLALTRIKQFLIPVPSMEEQVRIVDVLECISKKIELEQDNLDALKKTKVGLMQDLLTGKIRVKVDEPEVVSS